jgi:hypothetical protein
MYVEAFGEGHLRVASAIVGRSAIHRAANRRASAIADLERALAIYEAQRDGDVGARGNAEWLLGAQVFTRDRARGRALVERAVTHLGNAPQWISVASAARAWLAANP